jgi:RNA polymerase sigma factor (sigma-70 family)
VNMCRGKIRRQGIEHRVNVLVHRHGELRAPDWDPARSDRQLDVWDAVRSLPERQRACVVLRYLEDMTEAEIADALGCAVGTVKSQTARARQTLARLLEVGGDVS